MKRLLQSSILTLSIFYVSFAYAGVGQKIASKINSYNDELTIASLSLFVLGLILCGLSMIFGLSPRVKSWGVGLVLGSILVFFAPDIANLLAN